MVVTCRIVNSNFCGKVTGVQHHLENIKGGTLYSWRPRMVLVRYKSSTILIFSSGKFRIMGSPTHHREALRQFLSRNNTLKLVSPVRIQSHTVYFKLGRDVNFTNYANNPHFAREPEIFTPSLQFINNIGAEHVNIFAKGKVIITGAKSIQRSIDIIRELLKQL